MSPSAIEPFVQGVESLLSSMLGLTCEVTDVDEKSVGVYVSGVVGLIGDTNGQMVVSFPRDTGRAIVGEMLGMESEEVDDEILQDGVGEIANIVAGGAKGTLAGQDHHIQFSLPSIVVGENHKLSPYRGEEGEQRGIETEVGSFRIIVWSAPEGGSAHPTE